MTTPEHTASTNSATLIPVGALLLALCSFSFGASLAKGLFPAIGPEGAAVMRLTVAAVILAVAFRPWRITLGKDWPSLLAYGASLGAMNLMFYWSLDTIPLGLAIAIEFMGPLGLALVTSHRRIDLLWIGIAVIGLGLILPLHGLAQSLNWQGVAFALGAGVFWIGYIVFGQRAGKIYGSSAVAAGMIAGAVLIAPIGFVHAGSILLQPHVLGIGIAVGLFSSAIPYALEMVALRKLSSSTFGTLCAAEPAVGAVMGFALLDQILSPLQWLAIGMIVFASVGTAIGARPEPPAPTPL
jgi:inner membrane transporter RhtA